MRRALAQAQPGVGVPANAPSRHDAQERDITILVRHDGTDAPLTNAEVIVLGSTTRRFTGADGIAVLRVPAGRDVTLRVRQIGFVFRDQVVPASEAGTITVRLARIPFALPVVSTRASSACDGITASDGALESWALSQLREGAERYEAFRKEYPFDVRVIRRTITEPRRPRQRIGDVRERTTSARWGEPYRVGQVVHEQALGFSVPILFVSTLGDSAFWDAHCADRAVIDTSAAGPVVRLRFVPAQSIRTTDWEGEAYIDSTTSALRRVDFRLRVAGRGGPSRFEGYTTFREISPYVQVPDTTVAIWWRSAPEAGAPWGDPHVVQRVAVESLTFKRPPPARQP